MQPNSLLRLRTNLQRQLERAWTLNQQLRSTTSSVKHIRVAGAGFAGADGTYEPIIAAAVAGQVEYARQDRQGRVFSLHYRDRCWNLSIVSESGAQVLYSTQSTEIQPPLGGWRAKMQNCEPAPTLAALDSVPTVDDAEEEARAAPVWYQLTDEEGQPYYRHLDTGQTQWEMPEGFDPELQATLAQAAAERMQANATSTHQSPFFDVAGPSPSAASSSSSSSRELCRCTVEVTPSAVLSADEMGALFDAIVESEPAVEVGGVAQWLGFESEPLAFGLCTLLATCAIDTRATSGYAVCEALLERAELQGRVQSVRYRDGYSVSISTSSREREKEKGKAGKRGGEEREEEDGEEDGSSMGRAETEGEREARARDRRDRERAEGMVEASIRCLQPMAEANDSDVCRLEGLLSAGEVRELLRVGRRIRKRVGSVSRGGGPAAIAAARSSGTGASAGAAGATAAAGAAGEDDEDDGDDGDEDEDEDGDEGGGGGAWETVYMNTSNLFAREAPALYSKIVAAVKEADRQRWRLLCTEAQTEAKAEAEAKAGTGTGTGAETKTTTTTPPPPPVNVRCIELHTVRPGGSLADPCHYDWGSLLTLDIMLADPRPIDQGGDFDGGEFCCSDGPDRLPLAAADSFQRAGDALIFCSHKTHTVLPVERGCRRVCVIEFWRGEERACGHRCDLHWGACPFHHQQQQQQQQQQQHARRGGKEGADGQ